MTLFWTKKLLSLAISVTAMLYVESRGRLLCFKVVQKLFLCLTFRVLVRLIKRCKTGTAHAMSIPKVIGVPVPIPACDTELKVLCSLPLYQYDPRPLWRCWADPVDGTNDWPIKGCRGWGYLEKKSPCKDKYRDFTYKSVDFLWDRFWLAPRDLLKTFREREEPHSFSFCRKPLTLVGDYSASYRLNDTESLFRKVEYALTEFFV